MCQVYSSELFIRSAPYIKKVRLGKIPLDYPTTRPYDLSYQLLKFSDHVKCAKYTLRSYFLCTLLYYIYILFSIDGLSLHVLTSKFKYILLNLNIYIGSHAEWIHVRTVGHENKQQGHGPDEGRKDRPLAGHVVRGLDRSDEERAPQLSI